MKIFNITQNYNLSMTMPVFDTFILKVYNNGDYIFSHLMNNTFSFLFN